MRNPTWEVDPYNLRKTRNDNELQVFLLFAIVCAGKSAEQMAKKVLQFGGHQPLAPFDYMRQLDEQGALESELKRIKMGKYTDQIPGFRTAYENPDCVSWDRKELVTISGISWKTASFFQAYAYGAKVAILDTHAMRWMREKFPKLKMAKGSSPQDWDRYEILEHIFLGAALKAGLEPWELDREIWYAAKGAELPLEL